MTLDYPQYPQIDQGRRGITRAYVNALRARIAELEAALKPFAVMAGSYTDESGAHVPLSKGGAIISVYDLRRAENALTKSTV